MTSSRAIPREQPRVRRIKHPHKQHAAYGIW